MKERLLAEFWPGISDNINQILSNKSYMIDDNEDTETTLYVIDTLGIIFTFAAIIMTIIFGTLIAPYDLQGPDPFISSEIHHK